MHLLRQYIFPKCRRIIVTFTRNLAIYSKTTQLETANMSNLKTTNLQEISQSTFSLFQGLMQTDEIQELNEIFKKEGFEIRMAGGGVRDLLCGITPHDIDFATDAKPNEMLRFLSDKPNIRLITTVSGTRHGTVTARVNNKAQYEITTLRIDKSTDGRHADVEFVNDWKLDASRRDLTINSMFIDMNGILYDYFNGEAHLRNRTICFVGDPAKRIREDYLRIFRYFRFHTRFGSPDCHDSSTLAVIKDNIDGLQSISGERIWSELKRILSIVQCVDSVDIMFNYLKIGHYLGFLSPQVELDEFRLIQSRIEKTVKENPIEKDLLKSPTLFCSLVRSPDELSSITARLRFSNYERDMISYIMANRRISMPVNCHALKTQLAIAPKPQQAHLRDYILQYLFYMGQSLELIEIFRTWQIPKFPFNGSMIANRVKKRSEISKLLDELKSVWAHNNFSMSEEQVKEEIEKILQQFNVR